MPRANNLVEIVLDNIPSAETGVVMVVKTLKRSTKGGSQLTSLSCSSCSLGVAGVRAVSDFVRTTTKLKTLDLSFNNIGPDGLRVLAEGLGARELDGEQDSTLSLNLSYNPLVGRPYSADPTGVTDLFQALGRHKSSKVLSLGHTGIGHPNVALPCVMQIAKWLKNDRVETLDLSHNEIESVELHKLAMWLNRALPDLKVLDLTGNECYEG